ncbi:ribonucleotide reductase subunit alpha [Halomonas sp. ISL-60]|uniref:ribonucleotide reductase subunit alpha n=1 Tax=Halomonas sp. ISL-56 TaxID=2819149 RepID=UPI001BE84826|nr:ribonucleotide reductase subunit alpha [Halomonas sp. ISL-56]MBT2771131.1 ribonucleotide reductase subunit alpha [Halomonas sp. ISL-60]MBT2802202.1 ribonucleotide reductase subunit alpha [Halomonas sp. ISL-56]
MTIATFADLLQEAHKQPKPQRLLFVFVRAELPDFPDAEQRRRFEQGEGGVLVPVICVDKSTKELSSMSALVEESRRTEIEWDLVFAAAMDDPKDEAEVERQLQRMMESLQMGNITSFLAFDPHGDAVNVG